MHSPSLLCRPWLISLLPLGLLILLGPPTLTAAPSSRKTFDVPAGTAPATLHQFSAQAGGHLLYSAELVAGLKTQAVKGDLTAREALTRMVAGSYTYTDGQGDQESRSTGDRRAAHLSRPPGTRRP